MPQYNVYVKVTEYYKIEGIEAEDEYAAAEIAEDQWQDLTAYDSDVAAWDTELIGEEIEEDE